MRKVRLFAVMLLVLALLASSTFAAGDLFMPSVEQKGAPEVTATADGKDANIIVTPYSEKDNPDTDDAALAAQITAGLEQAKSDIDAVDSLGDLKSKDGTIASDLEKAIAGSGYTLDDLVVTDLFDVSAEDGYDGPMTLAIVVAGDVLTVLHSPEPGVWEVVPFTKDGNKIIINVDGLGPFALIAAKTNASGKDSKDDKTTDKSGEKVTSPQTGETVNSSVMIVAMLMLAAAVICAARAKRCTR